MFVVPNTHSFSLPILIVVEWKGKYQTLEAWNRRFRRARNNLEEVDTGIFTLEDINRDEEVNKLTKEFKIPKLNKIDQAV